MKFGVSFADCQRGRPAEEQPRRRNSSHDRTGETPGQIRDHRRRPREGPDDWSGDGQRQGARAFATRIPARRTCWSNVLLCICWGGGTAQCCTSKPLAGAAVSICDPWVWGLCCNIQSLILAFQLFSFQNFIMIGLYCCHGNNLLPVMAGVSKVGLDDCDYAWFLKLLKVFFLLHHFKPNEAFFNQKLTATCPLSILHRLVGIRCLLRSWVRSLRMLRTWESWLEKEEFMDR